MIQTQIDKAKAGTVICVRPGVYTGNINFMGKAVTLKSSTPLGATLQGNGKGPVVTFTSNESSASVLDGFRVTGGVAGAGGGILIVNSSPTITDCLITGNKATGVSSPRGGGAYVGGSEAAPSILCTCFKDNQSDYEGGGLEAADLAHPYLNEDSFNANSADFGGGLATDFSGLTNIENSRFQENSAAIDGGAIHVLTQFGTTMVRRTIFAGNKAPGGSGGGLWAAAGFATVLNSVFSGNSASLGGAAAAGFDSVVSVESSIFQYNSAGDATVSTDGTPGTSLVNNYNLFFSNTPSSPDYLNTYGNIGIIDADPKFGFGGCFAPAPHISPALHAGIPDSHFDNANNSTNTLGIYGGPVVP